MLLYILRRVFYMVPTLIVISIISFVIIQLPPGDYLTTYVAELVSQGETVNQATLDQLKQRYGLGLPVYQQYLKWIGGILLRGDFGQSFTWGRPVNELIWDRLFFTMLITFLTVMFVWIVSLPIGVYSAVRQYSLGDYLATFFGFLGLATPDFLLGLVLMYFALKVFGQSVGGLFSPEYQDAPWSLAKIRDFLNHLWIPIVILGTSGTAGLIRIMRANLLDELHKPYVTTARAKGVPERTLIWRYPVRVALNPFVSTIGWTLPSLVSGSIIVSVVLNLPTTGPLLLQALMQQDMYLAGSFILIVSALTVVGTLISDVLLAWLDPRIRFE
ncbi:MAG: ABC transporter permease [Caldilineaceae bacterium]|nr:ABC transporter permease [Caldilineaceae bacterium]HRJ42021.1 ABC transporter permease [Caldilineaceae bacterium]